MKIKTLLLIVTALLSLNNTYCQKVVSVTDTMTGFTLQSVQGKTVSLRDYKGGNVMLIFPRGKVNDSWCHICHYQYAEFSELEQKEKIEEKYNLQILFILPYDLETVEKWVKMLPKQIYDIEGWKNPAEPEKQTEREKNWTKMVREIFPHSYIIDSTNIPNVIPVLIDADHAYSKGLGIYTMQWDNSYVEQNMSSVYLIDKNGILQFKYISQNTFDRPDPKYLLKFIEKMMN
jgi:alkyl hydroperoxide reductase subunit AhpC